ncbi:MAG: hypothetical protein ACKVH0_08175 [Alphaproteobacteria bacterium]
MTLHTATDARAATKTGHVRYILAISLISAVVGLALSLAFTA